ncbi:MAG TPA: tripartite tricarboxylate transporter substrate binding protein [Eoetvoesiella sp.]
MNHRKSLKGLRATLMAVALGVVGVQPVCAQAAPADWPNKPLKLIVSFPPGGVTDTIARALQPRLSEGLGQPVVIENRGAAGGTLAEGTLARSSPDGYTMMLTADGVAANPHLHPNLPYDTFKDLLPVSLLVRIPLVMLVNPSVPANTVKDFVEYARVNSSMVSYASPGSGTSNHLFFEVFKDMAKLDIQHVPYKGGSPAMSDLMGGHVQALLITSTVAAPQLPGGKIKALAVTSSERSAQMPNVPTFIEAGYPDFKPHQWTGLFLPAGTPPAIVERIRTEFDKAMNAPEVVTRLRDLGAEPVMNTQKEFTELLQRDHAALGKLIKSRNISAQ